MARRPVGRARGTGLAPVGGNAKALTPANPQQGKGTLPSQADSDGDDVMDRTMKAGNRRAGAPNAGSGPNDRNQMPRSVSGGGTRSSAVAQGGNDAQLPSSMAAGVPQDIRSAPELGTRQNTMPTHAIAAASTDPRLVIQNALQSRDPSIQPRPAHHVLGGQYARVRR